MTTIANPSPGFNVNPAQVLELLGHRYDFAAIDWPDAAAFANVHLQSFTDGGIYDGLNARAPARKALEGTADVKALSSPKSAGAPEADAPKLDWALYIAEVWRLPVFPLLPNSKKPAVDAWKVWATTDAGKIRRAWTQNPDYNIGIHCAGLLVLDVDPKNGGDETYENLQRVHELLGDELQPTRTVRTQSGGHHQYRRLPPGQNVKNSAGLIGKGLDVRSQGGYVVAPGSTIDGRSYVVEDDREIATAPQWLIDAAGQPRTRDKDAGVRRHDEDEHAIAAARRHLNTHAVHIAEGGGRHQACYNMAAALFDYGIEEGTAPEFMHEWNATFCHPPIADEEVDRAIHNAMVNRQLPIGCRHPLNGFEGLALPMPEDEPGEAASNDARVRRVFATPLEPFVIDGLPPRAWLIQQLICRQKVSLIIGPGGANKSTFILMIAVALASGRGDIIGYSIPKPVRVWVWNQEDDVEEMHRQLAAIMRAYGVSFDDFGGRLFLNSGVDRPLMLAKRTQEQTIRPGRGVDDVIADVRERQIDVIMFDPLVEFHEAHENDNSQMRAVLGQTRRIAVETNCGVLLATHTRKPPQASSAGFAGEMDSARGASSQAGVIRIAETMFPMSEKDEKDWLLPPCRSRDQFVRLDMAKNNLGLRRPTPIWFQREGVRLGGFDGEETVVLRRVELVARGPRAQDAGSAALDRVLGLRDGKGDPVFAPRTWHELPLLFGHMTPDELALFPRNSGRGKAGVNLSKFVSQLCGRGNMSVPAGSGGGVIEFAKPPARNKPMCVRYTLPIGEGGQDAH